MRNVSLIDGHIDKMTNYERIKAMTFDELADLLDSFMACSNCRKNGNSCFPSYDIKKMA